MSCQVLCILKFELVGCAAESDMGTKSTRGLGGSPGVLT